MTGSRCCESAYRSVKSLTNPYGLSAGDKVEIETVTGGTHYLEVVSAGPKEIVEDRYAVPMSSIRNVRPQSAPSQSKVRPTWDIPRRGGRTVAQMFLVPIALGFAPSTGGVHTAASSWVRARCVIVPCLQWPFLPPTRRKAHQRNSDHRHDHTHDRTSAQPLGGEQPGHQHGEERVRGEDW